MRFYKCCFSAVILCIYWQESAAKTNSTNVTAKRIAKKQPVTLEFVKLKNLAPRNSTSKSKNSRAGNVGQKREIENGTFNPFESLFLLPILPFLFPPVEDNLIPFDGNELQGLKNDTGDKPQERGKPFVFFDFTFNMREIPVKNASERGNDSKIITVTKLEDTKEEKRKRRNTKHVGDLFFDETFPDAELDEFLPKPDLFFPDLSFHPKPAKKLSRKKRDEKPEVRNDIKFFLDSVDEAFMRTKKELERTDPILSFIKGMESSFGEEKKEFFNDEENPDVKWKVQRDVKRLNDGGESLGKNEDNPMIIMDKVVKIGQFRLHGDKHEGKKSKRKKKRDADKSQMLRDMNEGETQGKSILDMFKHDYPKNAKKYKRNHHVREKIESPVKFEVSSNLGNVTELTQAKNVTDESLDLVKVIDSVESKFREDLTEKKKQKRKKASYEDLKKNITRILNQFLEFVKKVGDGESPESHVKGDEDYVGDLGLFDWTEKEILDTRRRQKKEFPLEYVDIKKEERKIADIHKNIMSVTVPSILIILGVLMACIWALQPRGAFCKMLFRPRKVYTVAEEEQSDQEAPKKIKQKKAPQQQQTVKAEEGMVETLE